ncbi:MULTISPECIES: LysE family transporter [Croceibacter]|mgnify:CR=1 FL=1|uniref:LysE family transporter n=1 Tax=Croceibacter TaxID=216431 RepID=UPI000C5C1E59|nr:MULTISPECIES: LysE family transporter [Croceibacter]MBG25557.1 hypothetical protein [Croceibacter sp.]HAT69682.1 hypothetical protein [Flavobacteriaceae bacterium]|tara:strand:- start:5665 stop:6297 length:633 start_codon:yes stop_codon:yes gene_type:complete
MIILYLFVGVLATILSAIPLGAVNISVIQTTLKSGEKTAFKIALGAGFGEILLALLALNFNMMIASFFERNMWLHLTIILLFFIAGIYFLVKKPSKNDDRSHWYDMGTSKYLKGFVLSLLNPPVMIYWLVAFSIINKHLIMITSNSSPLDLLVFFIGVYLGKVLTLYGYSKWSNTVKGDTKTVQRKVSRFLGVVLLGLAIFQGIKFLVNS